MAANSTDGSSVQIMCELVVGLNRDLHIRNGSALFSRNIRGHVTNQLFTEPLLGLPVLESLGVNTQRPSHHRCRTPQWQIRLKTLSGNNGGVGLIARVYKHSDNGLEKNSENEDKDTLLDLGKEDKSEWESELQSRLSQNHRKTEYSEGARTILRISFVNTRKSVDLASTDVNRLEFHPLGFE